MRTAVVAAAAGALLVTTGRVAEANGRLPASNQLVVSPSDPNVVVLRATFGILLSHDAGATWGWLCEDVIGVPSTSAEDPSLALTAGGSLIAGVSVGLAVSPDTGCSWRFVDGALSQQYVKDVTVRPENAHVALALTSAFDDHAAEGGPGYLQQVYESRDDATSWSALGIALDPTADATALEVAATDDHRIYVSALRSAGQAASLFVSTDQGSSWTERPIPLDASRESAVYIAAVDPMNADRVYLRTAGSTSTLLVTDDAGQTYRAVLSLDEPMLGFALSPDGSKVYAGGAERGLLTATTDQFSFQNVSTLPIQCLAAQGLSLWACSRDNQAGTGFIAGVSNDDGVTFAPRLHLAAEPMISCAADATAAQCGGDPQQAYCQVVQGCRPDGGVSARGASSKACGCFLVRPIRGPSKGADYKPEDEGAALASAATVLALALRARRTRRAAR